MSLHLIFACDEPDCDVWIQGSTANRLDIRWEARDAGWYVPGGSGESWAWCPAHADGHRGRQRQRAGVRVPIVVVSGRQSRIKGKPA